MWGWFYAARELDSQLGVLTEETKYSTLQKSYSIWICNEDIPKEEQNSMTSVVIHCNIPFKDVQKPFAAPKRVCPTYPLSSRRQDGYMSLLGPITHSP